MARMMRPRTSHHRREPKTEARLSWWAAPLAPSAPFTHPRAGSSHPGAVPSRPGGCFAPVRALFKLVFFTTELLKFKHLSPNISPAAALPKALRFTTKYIFNSRFWLIIKINSKELRLAPGAGAGAAPTSRAEGGSPVLLRGCWGRTGVSRETPKPGCFLFSPTLTHQMLCRTHSAQLLDFSVKKLLFLSTDKTLILTCGSF